jgi:DNA invertase Pin-like site-specific DNA recombinase
MPNNPITKQFPVHTESDRINDLVVCRESSVSKHILMEGMIAQTVSSVQHLAGASDVQKAGLSPLTGKSQFDVMRIKRVKTNAVLFAHEETVYLYSMGSAALTTSGTQDNAFIELLVEIIEEYRPRNLWVATFSRLVRSTEFSGRLQQAAKRHVDMVHCGTHLILPNTSEGKVTWTVLAMISDGERDMIVQRLFAGKCTTFLRGEWVFSKESVPPGYVMGDDKRIRVDEAAVPAVRTLLTLMADHTLSARQICDEVGRIGLTSLALRRNHGAHATYSSLRNPSGRISSLIDWLPTYQSGVIKMYHANPFPGAEQIAGLPVIRKAPEDPGSVCMAYEVGLPDGGWVADDILAAAATRGIGRRERKRTGGAMHRDRRPLVGLEWEQDGVVHRLSSLAHKYVIVRGVTEEGQGEEV